MDQNSSLFSRLPRELRDDVYRYHVVSNGGFICDPVHDSLCTTSGGKIDLALHCTCKRVAEEVIGKSVL
jgi:hypothetical protein